MATKGDRRTDPTDPDSVANRPSRGYNRQVTSHDAAARPPEESTLPIERKPLFRPDVMHQHLVEFALPERIAVVRPKLTHWADLIGSGRADKLNEKELLPDFLTDFFVELLGYTKLQSPLGLDSDGFVAEVKKLRGKKNPLSAAALRNLRDEYVCTIEPTRQLVAKSMTRERQLSDLVNEVYGLTPDEVSLLWDTAPPRMPISDSRAVAGLRPSHGAGR